MSLRFIIGRAGSGKTYKCLEEIRQELRQDPDGPPIILLVPEQATFQMEYALAATPGIGGSIRAQVLSFRRLAHRVLLEVGGAARVPIGELGKRMVLRELLERHKSSLKVFDKSADRIGFTDCLARTIGEMKTYLVTPDILEDASRFFEEENPMLRDKLADIALLFRDLEEYLAPRYTDPDDYLKLLAEKLLACPLLRGAQIWIDGFKGFTPQEFIVIEKILQANARVNAALCLDPGCLNEELTEEDLFYPTWETYHELIKIAKKAAVDIEKPTYLNAETPYRFRGCPDIAHLEKNFYSYPARIFEGERINIKLAAGANRRAEVEACAREIIRFARDKYYRWRDMAVILRDLESYHELISNVFTDYNIPFFIDRKRTVLHHPLVELIRSALEVAAKNWPYEAVFRYLKTDLVSIDREKVYLLENYVLSHGIQGSKWKEEKNWSFRRCYTLGEDAEITNNEFEEAVFINEVRREAVGVLINFCNKLIEAKDVRTMTRALYELLEELKVPETIEEWRADAEKAGQLDKAREHGQIWSAVMSLMDEVVEALGSEALTLETYSDILDAGFQSMDMGLIPPGLDQVLVGSLDRSRNPDIKAVFLLGASDGVLPARLTDDGIFNDSEREKLEALGIKLSPGGRRRSFDEKFLVYTALTRASEKMWISYPMADDEGRAMAPSMVVERIKELIPLLEETSYQVEPLLGDEGEALEFLAHPERALTYLTGRLREAKAGRIINPFWWELYNWFLEDNRLAVAREIIKSVFYSNNEKALDSNTSRSLYGNPIRASVSRIEKFIACPFAYFSSYGLKLRERDIFCLEAPDMGEFFHAALKKFAENIKKKSMDWGDLSREECISLSEEVVEELAPRLQNEILLSTARYRYLTGKLKKAVNRAVIVLAEHARRSVFRPVGLELEFGPGGQLPPVIIKLPGGDSLELRGRIDRLDMARTEGGTYLRVIDYKSGNDNVKIEDIFYGLKLQLLTYLYVALKHCPAYLGQEGKPGGILYFTVREPLIRSKGPLLKEDVEREIFKELRMRGFLLADREVLKMMDERFEISSDLFKNVALKRDGSFRSNSAVFNEEQFKMLGDYLEKVFALAGEEILHGKVSIEPYLKKGLTACRYCSFKPVCKFDILMEGNKYRVLPEVSADKVWKLMAGKEGENEQSPLD